MDEKKLGRRRLLKYLGVSSAGVAFASAAAITKEKIKSVPSDAKEELEKLLSALESFTCSECGEEVGLDDNKCPECDSVFAGADEMVCSGCVAVVKGNAESCPECEAEFE